MRWSSLPWCSLTQIVSTIDFAYRLIHFFRMTLLAFRLTILASLGVFGNWFLLREVIKFSEEGCVEYLQFVSVAYVFFANLGLCVLAYLLRDATDPNEDNENQGSLRCGQLWFVFNSLKVLVDFHIEYKFHRKFPDGYEDEEDKLFKFSPPTTAMICIEIFLTVLWFLYRLTSLVIVFEFARELRQVLKYNQQEEELMRRNTPNNVWGTAESVDSVLRRTSRTEEGPRGNPRLSDASSTGS